MDTHLVTVFGVSGEDPLLFIFWTCFIVFRLNMTLPHTHRHDLPRLSQSLNRSEPQTVVRVYRSRTGLFAYFGQHLGQIIDSQWKWSVPHLIGDHIHPLGLQIQSFCVGGNSAQIFLQRCDWAQRIAGLFIHSPAGFLVLFLHVFRVLV